ncbi:hypothetical protein MD484_g4307, partial [Candolleomyces efflorescens]
MIFNLALVALTATAGTVVKAQDPGSLGITPCILACITPAAQANNCTSFADIPCVCGSAQFQADARACLEQNCPSSELEAAVAVQTAQCGAAGITPSGTAGPPQTLSFTSPPAQSTTGSTSTTGSVPSGSTTTAPGTSQTSPAGSSAAQTPQRAGWAGLAVFAALAGLAL